MRAITAKPLDWIELLNITHKDANMDLDGYKCRYLMASEGQEIEVDTIYYDSVTNMKFGLREAKKPQAGYEYLAFRIL